MAVTAGSAGLLMMPSLAMQTDAGIAAALVAAAGIGGVFPDFDHKTSTVSNRIQFPLRYRRLFKTLSGFVGIVGIGLMAYQQFGNVPGHLGEWVKSGPLWLGAAILFWLLARLRSLVLIGIGALLLAGYAIYDLHWIAAFAGFAFLILPLVKHRGVIHTPEFAAVLSIGLLNFSLSNRKSSIWQRSGLSSAGGRTSPGIYSETKGFTSCCCRSLKSLSGCLKTGAGRALDFANMLGRQPSDMGSHVASNANPAEIKEGDGAGHCRNKRTSTAMRLSIYRY